MEKGKMLTWDFAIVCAIGFLSSFGTSVAETLVTKYAESLGALPGMIGAVSSVCSITALIVLPLSAPLLDAFKKTHIYLIFTAFLAAAYAGFAVSKTVEMLIIFRLINGIGKGVNSAVAMAMASDVLPEDRRSSGVVYFSLASAISIAFAPSVSLFLLDVCGYQVTFVVGAALEALTMGMGLLIRFKFLSTGKLVISLNNMVAKESIPAAVLMFFLSTAYSTVNSFLVVFATGMGIDDIGIYFTVYSLVLLVSRPIVGKLSGRFTNSQMMVPAMFCFAGSMYLTAISDSVMMFVITAVIAAFGYGICQPLVQAMSIQKAGPGRSGIGSSTCFIGTNLGYFFGPAVGGLIAEHFGYSTMYICTIIPLVFGMGIILNETRSEKRKGVTA